MAGQSTHVTMTASNLLTAGTNADGINYTGLGALANGGTGGIGQPVSSGSLAVGNSVQMGETLTAATSGAYILTPTASVTGANGTFPALSPTNSVTVYALANRVVTATAANFGTVHVLATPSATTNLTTTGGSNSYTSVTVGTTLFNSSSSAAAAPIAETFSQAGTAGGTATLVTTGEGLPGESPINVSVPYTASVFSGSGSWTGGSGSWASTANWTDPQTPSIHAAPGTFAGFVNTDAASFSGSGGTVNLLNASPSLAALNISGNYTLAPSSGGSGQLTLDGSSGPATIAASGASGLVTAPLVLASNALVTVVPNGVFTINGSIGSTGGAYGLTSAGSGTLVLGGVDTYAGGTSATAGLLVIASSTALPASTVLYIAPGAVVDLADPALGAGLMQTGSTGRGGSAPAAAANLHASAVPEPCTLALLLAAAAGGGLAAWRKRKGI
jgi:hypothetical protein